MWAQVATAVAATDAPVGPVAAGPRGRQPAAGPWPPWAAGTRARCRVRAMPQARAAARPLPWAHGQASLPKWARPARSVRPPARRPAGAGRQSSPAPPPAEAVSPAGPVLPGPRVLPFLAFQCDPAPRWRRSTGPCYVRPGPLNDEPRPGRGSRDDLRRPYLAATTLAISRHLLE